MKRLRKRLAFIPLGLLMFALLTTTLPTNIVKAEETTYSITIDNSTTDHDYKAFQILSGTVSSDQLSQIDWGYSISETGKTDLLKLTSNDTGYEIGTEEKYKNVASLASSLDDGTKDSDKAKSLAELLATSVNLEKPKATFAYDTENKKYTAALPAGYYLIIDTEPAENETSAADSYSRYILTTITAAVTIETKSKVPQLEKKVMDYDYANKKNSDWQDSADYDVDKLIPFKLTATLASDYADYKQYAITFHDDATGYIFDADTANIEVYLDGVSSPAFKETEDYTVNTSCTDGCTFEISFTDLKTSSLKSSISGDSTITVEYKMKLNKDAATIGSSGNPNYAWLTYTNSQNGNGTGKTEPDKVIVFTYMVVINKLDGSNGNEALSGATFELYKKNSSDGWDSLGELGAADVNDTNIYSWSGLGDGKYKLVENSAPSGYTRMTDIEFTISANHDAEWLSQEQSAVLTDLSGDTESGVATFAWAEEEDPDALKADVLNYKGSTLPSTGGIGTTLFYILGSILVLSAAILMITKRRMDSRKQ